MKQTTICMACNSKPCICQIEGFEISDYCYPCGLTRANVLAVQVVRWSDGSYLEDEDHWWLSGINRDVLHLTKPQILIYQKCIVCKSSPCTCSKELLHCIPTKASVQVFRWSDGSYLDDQDHWWLPAIHHDVLLLAKPQILIYQKCIVCKSSPCTCSKELLHCIPTKASVQVLRWSDGSYLEYQDHRWLPAIHPDVLLPAKPQVQHLLKRERTAKKKNLDGLPIYNEEEENNLLAWRCKTGWAWAICPV